MDNNLGYIMQMIQDNEKQIESCTKRISFLKEVLKEKYNFDYDKERQNGRSN